MLRSTEMALARLGHSLKEVDWKIALARLLRDHYLALNKWIAEHLHMGHVSTVQSLVSRHRIEEKGKDIYWEMLKNHEKLG